jgi:Glycosyltransferase family 87
MDAQGMRSAALYAVEFGLLIVTLYVTRLISIYVWELPNGDVKLYRDYALTFWTRGFHALPVEYPPLALLPFTLALLPPFGDYFTTYALWMLALVVLGYIGFLFYSSRRRALVYAVYLIVGAAGTLLARFDLIPALLTLGALWATQRRRFGWAYALIALGVLTKLYPAFLLPIVMIAQWRAATARARIEGYAPIEKLVGRWWWDRPTVVFRRLWAQPATPRLAAGAGLCVGIIALGFWAALAISPAGALSGFNYAGARPLQIESTPATLLWLGTLLGIPAHPDYSFVSLNYVGPLDIILKPLSLVALLALCLLVYWRQAQGRLTVGQAFVACLCAVLATNKIFSPQYLIWLLPVVAAVEGFDLLWLAICVLTTLNYPIIYQMRHPIWTVPYTPEFMPVLAVRNLLLLYVTARAIIGPRRVSPALSLTSQRIEEALKPVERVEATPAPEPVESALVNQS